MGEIRVGDRVLLEKLPESVRADDPDDEIFRECIGRELIVAGIEENGDLKLDVRPHSARYLNLYVPRIV